MGQSLAQNYLHIVFGTKHRKPCIKPAYANDLYCYIGGICNGLECQAIIVGGYRDHVHILCRLNKKVALMNLVEKVKSHSSKWIKTKFPELSNFYWQNGYGAFSVSRDHVTVVTNYIATQEAHHNKKTFQEEYRAMLIEAAVEFDERYVWD